MKIIKDRWERKDDEDVQDGGYYDRVKANKGDKMIPIAPDTSKVPPPKSNTNTICRLLRKAQKNKIK